MPAQRPPSSQPQHGIGLSEGSRSQRTSPSLPSTPDLTRRSSSPPLDDQTTLAHKRRIEALEEENERLKGTKQTKPKTTRTLGRPIRKVVALFAPVNSLVQEYERRLDPEAKAEDEELNNVDTDQLNEFEHEEYEQCLELKRSRDRDYESFKLLCLYVPYIKKKVYSQQVNHAELRAEYPPLESGANSARSEDIHNGAMELADWLNQRNPGPQPRIDHQTRAGRGFIHDFTGRLLCPIDFNWDDLTIRAEIRAIGRRSVVKDSAFPFFLPFMYLNEIGDVENPLKGWLQGPLLVKMMLFLFKSASSVGNEVVDNGFINQSSDDENIDPLPLPSTSGHSSKRRKSTKKTVSQLWGINAVSPRMIAYTATLLRFILSDGPSWGADDSFPYESFYNGIIDFFEDVETDSDDEIRTKRLLSWWTRVIYGSDDGNNNASTQPLKNFKNSLKSYRAAQHSRREAAKAAKTSASASTSTE
ncbi:hypothetical protein F5878DRAFT_603160 [Lentinula raphanica]|uniref:Uncharacterized protein n=1 Tax=Lentinula raphanica TaxID=153919 RepID=A0AA38UJF8_9AGAR|nr:hypothetical protein F5878DRAFT_603160 [Lentinula raphanica]